VVQANSDVHVATGYKQNQTGFGWTNSVYLKMKGIMEKAPVMAASASK
jgi:alpha,alpha-trehalase